jgi:hypothetical protein
MRRLWFSLSLVLVLLISAVLPVVAQSEPAQANVGTGITLFILAVVLAVIFAVAIIAAVGLGVIGLGYRSVQNEE